MKITTRNTLITLTIGTTALFSTPGLMAHGGATGVVKERMDQMVVLKKAMKKLAAIYKGRVDYDADAIRRATSTISNNAGTAMTHLFPVGSLTTKSEAKAEIWQQWNNFNDLANQLQTTSQQLHDAAGSPVQGDRRQEKMILKRMVKTCSACHDRYRADD